MSVCKKCKKFVRPKQQLLNCRVCRSNYHRTCINGITQEVYRNWKKDGTTDAWSCCTSSSKPGVSSTPGGHTTSMSASVVSPPVISSSAVIYASVSSPPMSNRSISGNSSSPCSPPVISSSILSSPVISPNNSSLSASSSSLRSPSVSFSSVQSPPMNSSSIFSTPVTSFNIFSSSVTSPSNGSPPVTTTSNICSSPVGSTSTETLSNNLTGRSSPLVTLPLLETSTTPQPWGPLSSCFMPISKCVMLVWKPFPTYVQYSNATFEIEQRVETESLWTESGTSGKRNTYEAKGIKEHCSYFFRVIANHNGRLSKPLYMEKPIRVGAIPANTPEIVSACSEIVTTTPEIVTTTSEVVTTCQEVVTTRPEIVTTTAGTVTTQIVTSNPFLKNISCEESGRVQKTAKAACNGMVQMKPLVFYETLHDIITALPMNRNSIMVTGKIKFTLSTQQFDLVKKSRSRDGKYGIKIFIRFCVNDKTTQQEDYYSTVGSLYVNHRFLPLQTTIDFDKKKKKKPCEPIDITDQCNLIVNRQNEVEVSWKEIGGKVCGYCASVIVARKIPTETLLEKLKYEKLVAPKHTEDFVKDKLKEDLDSDIATTSLRASLLCPIGKMRLVTPCRGTGCGHIQCVDALTVLKMNETKPRWLCPICEEPAPYDELHIDGLFLKILESVSDKVNEIEFLQDGSWRQKGLEESCIDLDVSMLSKSMDVIDLTETDDESTPLKKRPLGLNHVLMNKAYATAKSFLGSIKENLSTKSSSMSCNTNTELSDSCNNNSSSAHRNYPTTSSISTIGTTYQQSSSRGCDRNRNKRNWSSRPYERDRYRNNYNSNNDNYRSYNGSGYNSSHSSSLNRNYSSSYINNHYGYNNNINYVQQTLPNSYWQINSQY